MNNLFLILNAYSSQKQVADLIADLNEIKSEFDQVEITYEMGEPEIVEQDGMIMIVQNEKSMVHITDQQMEKIIEKTEEIRNKLTAII